MYTHNFHFDVISRRRTFETHQNRIRFRRHESESDIVLLRVWLMSWRECVLDDTSIVTKFV
jgi:hypothetical protein